MVGEVERGLAGDTGFLTVCRERVCGWYNLLASPGFNRWRHGPGCLRHRRANVSYHRRLRSTATCGQERTERMVDDVEGLWSGMARPSPPPWLPAIVVVPPSMMVVSQFDQKRNM